MFVRIAIEGGPDRAGVTHPNLFLPMMRKRRRIRRDSLLVQVLLPLLVLQAVSMAVAFHVVFGHLDRVGLSLVQEHVDRVAYRMELVADSAPDLLMVERFLSRLLEEEQFAYLGLLVPGRLDVELDAVPREELEAPLAQAVAEAERFLRTGESAGRVDRGAVQGRVIPVRLVGGVEEGEVVAAVVLLFDGSGVMAEVRERNRTVVWSMALMWLLFMVVLGLLIWGRVIRRLGRLSRAVEDLDEGPFRWRPDGVEDEIARLGRRLRGVLEERDEIDGRFRRLASNARDVIFRYEFHPVPRFTFVSAAVERMLGYTPEEMYADPAIGLRMVHPDERERMAAMYAGDVPEEPFQLRWLHRDGTVVWTEQVNVLLRDAQGRITAVEGIGRDITARRVAEQARRESESLLVEVASTTPSPMWIADATGNIIWVNARWLEHTGRRLEDELDDGWADCLHPEERDDVVRSWRDAVAARRTFQKEYRLRRHDGRWHWFIDHGRPRFDEAGDFVGFIGTLMDVTTLRETTDRLRQAAAVFASTRDGVYVTDAEHRITAVNRAFEQITGYAEAEVVGETEALMRSDRHDERFFRDILDRLAEDGHWQGEVWNRRKSGESYPQWLSISTVLDDEGAVINYVGVFTDISRLKRQERRLEHLAHYDPLTGLPNRMLLHSRLKRATEQARRNDTDFAVLVIDLDRFKTINDSLGHGAGDALLQRIVARLETVLGATDTLARIGGDEFVLLREQLGTPTEAGQLAQRLLDRFSEPFALEGGREVYLGASIGIGIYPDDGEDAAALLRNADAAMFAAKQGGRGTFRFYTAALTDVAQARLDMETRLRRALENGELSLLFQPLVCTLTDRAIGVEALVRWNDEVLGQVSPEAFIPVAEDARLIADLGRFVLRSACFTVQGWRSEGHRVDVLSVNLSPLQLLQPDVVAMVRDALDASGLASGVLELEITESALMDHREEVERVLSELKALGVRIVIDDFGTGYSSLAYLRRFPVDKLKIDRSFMAGVPHDPRAVEIAATIVAMARGLKLDVVAEGVEQEAQLAFLRDQKCPVYQGYLFSRPVEAASVVRHFDRVSGPVAGHGAAPEAGVAD
ncbi:MAG: EAL domain-containing protein [Deltaproteobacteria bacterium]|nr:MAG: EAL domain-containing protein [Deltaproteobacteria bacterium]